MVMDNNSNSDNRYRVDDIKDATKKSMKEKKTINGTNNNHKNEAVRREDDTPNKQAAITTSYDHNNNNSSSLFRNNDRRRLSVRSQELLRRSSSSAREQLPETPAGWAVFLSAVSSALLGYELRLQKRLTRPPLVYGQAVNNDDDQDDMIMKRIYRQLTSGPHSILSRDIKPSLFVGTRNFLASAAACRPAFESRNEDEHITFRQILTMTQDGATIALDWELPILDNHNNHNLAKQQQRQRRKDEILNGPIHQPVVLILHGMANDSSFLYVRSLQRTCSDRGWVSVGMNLRGCGGIPLSTPRGYNGAYTGDLRCVVRHISARLGHKNVPLFLVGYSLGANLVSKYLGEEGLSGTLPKCVAGGVSSGNPLEIDARTLVSPWSEILALGVKKTLIGHYPAFRKMVLSSPMSRSSFQKALFARGLADVDNAVAPGLIRNEPVSPYAMRIGFQNGEEYWTDASSYRLIRNVSVPLLQIIASDDPIVAKSFRRRLTHLIMNPNILTVETLCGGHLGWQESPPSPPPNSSNSKRSSGRESSSSNSSASWADSATADFIEAILKTRYDSHHQRITTQEKDNNNNVLTRTKSPTILKSRL